MDQFLSDGDDESEYESSGPTEAEDQKADSDDDKQQIKKRKLLDQIETGGTKKDKKIMELMKHKHQKLEH